MRITYFILVFLAFSQVLSAQELELKMTASKETVSIGQKLQVDIILIGSTAPIIAPEFDNCTILTGPYVYEGADLSLDGLKMYKKVSYVISPSKVGELIIDAAKAQTSGGTLSSNKLSIEVIAGSSRSQQDSLFLEQGLPNNFKLVAIPSKTEVMVGEPISINYTLFADHRSVQLNEYGYPPQPSGFTNKMDLIQDPQWEYDPEGRYKKLVLATQVLSPISAGDYELEPYVISVVKVFGFQGKKFEARSEPLSITVLPLPAGAGDNFRGAVGQFELKSSLSETEVSTNEPVYLRVKISGSGNLESITLPEPKLDKVLEIYDPEYTNKVKTTADGLSGSRIIEYLIIPRVAGTHEIPAITFEYFDTQSGKYLSYNTPSYTLGAEGSGSLNQDASPGLIQPRVTSEDIRHIHPSAANDEGLSFVRSWKFALTLAMPFILLGLLVLGKHQKNKRTSVALLKQQQAERVAHRYLQTAKAQLDAGDARGFYSSLYQAMQQYLSKKLKISTADMKEASIQQGLNQAGVSAAQIEDWLGVLRQCQAAAYSIGTISEAQPLYTQVVDQIGKLEQQL